MTDTADAGRPTLQDSVLDDLHRSTGGDPAFLVELIEAYLTDGKDQLDAIDTAIAGTDPAGLALHAHTLKSTSASVGALRLSEICRRLEGIGRSGAIDEAPPEVAAARAEWPDVDGALRRRMSDIAPQ